MTDTKWPGIEKLADELNLQSEFRVGQLRRALEPLLEAAHRVSLILPSSEALEAKLAIGREVDKWK